MHHGQKFAIMVMELGQVFYFRFYLDLDNEDGQSNTEWVGFEWIENLYLMLGLARIGHCEEKLKNYWLLEYDL